jgi:hypothetical protein
LQQIAYHGLSKATEKKAAEKLPCRPVPEWWSFLDQSFVVGFRSRDDFDFRNIGLQDYVS